MGRGTAQLGKAVKGKSKNDRRRNQSSNQSINQSDSLQADVLALEEYERLAQLTEFHRSRLRQLAQVDQSINQSNKRLLIRFYRTVLRHEKVDELKKELLLLTLNFTRDLLRKNSLIDQLKSEILASEELLLNIQRHHINQLSEITLVSSSTFSSVKENYEREMFDLYSVYRSEHQAMSVKYQSQRDELKSLIDALENEESSARNEAKQHHETLREELRNKNLESINDLRVSLENKIEELQRSFEEQHRVYVESTQSTQTNFSLLKDEDAVLSLQIYEKKRKIKNLTLLFNHVKTKMASAARQGAQRNLLLTQEKQTMNDHCSALKNLKRSFTATSEKKLSLLSSSAHDCLKKHRTQIELVEKILVKMELARKKETEKERVLSFRPLDALNQSGNQSGNQSNNQSQITPLTETALTGFFDKYNKVLLDTEAIEKEKSRLKVENAQLRNLLQQFLDGIAITNQSINGPNPLLIVNERSGRVNTEPSCAMTRRAEKQAGGKSINQSVMRKGPPRITQDGQMIVQQISVQTRGIAATVRTR